MSAPVATVKGVSNREFAALDGCDEALVRRAVKNGKLPLLAGGLLDPALAKTGWRKANRRAADAADSADKLAVPVSAPADKPAARKLPVLPTLDLDDPESVQAIDTFIQQVLRGDFAELAEAEKAKENGLALKHLLDGRRKARESISFKAAQDAFFAAGREGRDAWLAWAPRVATELAAEFGIDSRALADALTRLVHQHLTELGEPEFEPGQDDGEG